MAMAFQGQDIRVIPEQQFAKTGHGPQSARINTDYFNKVRTYALG
jgi:hypothetical protein